MVWSDPEIKKLSREFVAVADEVYMLYPEDPGNLNRVKDRPEHQFFKKYGESMPPGAWHHPGTKQGIYMMGPEAEYLEGRFAASGDAGDIRARLRRALERWDALRAQRGYANRPLPAVKFSPPPGARGELVLRANLRDLPRGAGDRSGARFADVPGNREFFPDYVKWAWNENWIGLPSARAFVPAGSAWEPVEASAVARIYRETFVDNVRGQAPIWQPGEVRTAELNMRRMPGAVGRIEYRGRARMESGGRGYEAQVYGQGDWDEAGGRFRKLDLVAVGSRWGAARFNRRENDPGPAPMGVALSLFVP